MNVAGRNRLSPPGRVLVALARGYQRVVSPWLPPACRYIPSCSQYLIEAVSTHGALAGAWLGAKRVLRCHPFGGHGPDPVPAPAGRAAALHRPSQEGR